MPFSPRPKKALGQHFLVNPGVVEKILDRVGAGPGDWVVEIGPGPGALTSPLTERAGRVVAVELDRQLAASLPDRVSRPEHLQVEVGDAANFDYARLAGDSTGPGRLLVVGNLPYNAALPILRRVLAFPEVVPLAVFMFQREVALRLGAAPSTSSYGLLSVVTQQRARVERVCDVAPGSFRPPPRVRSAVVALVPHAAAGRLPGCCLEVHDRFVRAAFANRRKTLRNNLRRGPFSWARVEGACREVAIDLSLRAEAVEVSRYRALATLLCEHEASR